MRKTKLMRCDKCGRMVTAHRKQRRHYAVWHIRKHECEQAETSVTQAQAKFLEHYVAKGLP